MRRLGHHRYIFLFLFLREVLAWTYFPTQYILHISIGIITILVLHAFSQGRRTNRERDLHARVVIITVCSNYGAHIIALSPDPIDAPNVTILMTLLRSTKYLQRKDLC